MQILFTISDVKIQDLVDSDRNEICLYLASCRLADQRFAATGRTVKQHAAANFLTVRLEEGAVLQRVNDLHPDLFLDLLHAAHVSERDFRLLQIRRAVVLLFELADELPSF